MAYNQGYGGGQQGGYAQGGPGGGPAGGGPAGGVPGGDPQLWFWFSAVDSDRSGQLTADELQRALTNGDWTPFNIDTVHLMIRMFDRDHSGTVGFQEFVSLWRYIEEWRKCYRAFDADGSGAMERHEFKNALKTFGFNLSDKFIDSLIHRFDLKGGRVKGNVQGRGTVSFDNFIQACVMIRSLTDQFQRMDTDRDGVVQLQYNQFLEVVMDGQ